MDSCGCAQRDKRLLTRQPGVRYAADMTIKLETGDAVPAFSGTDQEGKLRSERDFLGTKLAMYFYPKVFTPGCTTEACDFRDRHEHFLANGYQVLGVSPDDPESLAKFKTEYNLPFDLLSDPDHEIATSFGAYGLKKNYGREYVGIIRSTFLISDTGTIQQAYYNVKATGHAERIARTVGTT